MPISMQNERENIYRLDLRGTLQKADFDKWQERLVGEMARVGPVRLLFVLDGFEGWGADHWSDMSFYLKHGDKIERIAIVGPVRWRDEALMFAAAGLRKAPVEFFPAEELAKARAWVSSSPASGADKG